MSRIIKVDVGVRLRLITLIETLIILDITETESIIIALLYIIERILFFSLRLECFQSLCQLFVFVRFSQFFLFYVISKQLLCHLRRPFCVFESLSSTTFSMSCTVNEANLEVMFLLLHRWQATQSARTWHDYPWKSCTVVIHDMITRDLECPWHD